MIRITIAAVAAALIASSAMAADDFNRPNAPTLGVNWTQRNGESEIIDNKARAGSAVEDFHLATFNGGSGNVVEFDIFSDEASTQYGAAILGFADLSNNYFIKVQNNGLGTKFDHFAFYYGNNGDGLFAAADAAFSSARIRAEMIGTVAKLTITPDAGPVQTYAYDYGVETGGSGIGLGFYGAARIDNFNMARTPAVPEPATWAMMIGGFALAGNAARKRNRTAALA